MSLTVYFRGEKKIRKENLKQKQQASSTFGAWTPNNVCDSNIKNEIYDVKFVMQSFICTPEPYLSHNL